MKDIKMLLQYFPIHTIVLFTIASIILFYLSRSTRYKAMLLSLSGFLFVCLYASPFYSVIVFMLTSLVYLAGRLLIKWKSRIIAVTMVLICLACLVASKSGSAEHIAFFRAGSLLWGFSTFGISYFTFKYIHMIIDIYRGRIKEISYLNFLSYIFFFPTFTAGPIARYPQFNSSLTALSSSGGLVRENINEGIKRIIYGLFKKFIIADKTGLLITSIASDFQSADILGKTALILLYSIRVYYDFSGYSDIAIGLGRLFGIVIPENFNNPYQKSNIALFWQNWHMTLTSWLREYVYMPLGRLLMPSIGQKHPWLLNTVCQLATMSAVGLWHGFSMNYLLWGFYHGLGLAFHRVYSEMYKKYIPQHVKKRLAVSKIAGMLSTAATFIFVSAGWILFYK